MTDVFTFSPGALPLLISVPHDGRELPQSIRTRMTAAGLRISDTDWHVAKLYNFARDFGAHVLVANYSRYVVDLNRSAGDGVLYPGQVVTGLCPTVTFSGEAIYSLDEVDSVEIEERVGRYWQPYHEQIQATLDSIRRRFGYALLWDAHSIPSNVPRLFDGELPVLNLGSNDGRSCAGDLESVVAEVMLEQCNSSVLNGRFKGGYITRNYGSPEHGVHALQLEIAQRAYMDERTLLFDEGKADRLRPILQAMIDRFLRSAQAARQIQ
jgi:N-formylglutamate amidohydrolase